MSTTSTPEPAPVPVSAPTLQHSDPLPEPVVSISTPPPTSSEPRVPEHVAHLKQVFSYAKRYLLSLSEDVAKPSIKSFLEMCDTNPRTAAIIATPAILAFMVALTFLILATLLLVLWTVVSVLVGVAFVVVGAVLSLVFKLLIVVAATIPLAGIAGGLFVGANSAAQYVMSKLPSSQPSTSSQDGPAGSPSPTTQDLFEKFLIGFEKFWDILVSTTAATVVLLIKLGQMIVERAAPAIPTETTQGSEDDGREPITRAWDGLVASIFPVSVAHAQPSSARAPGARELEVMSETGSEDVVFVTPEHQEEWAQEEFQLEQLKESEPIIIRDGETQSARPHRELTRRTGFSTPGDEVDEPTI